jgi:hypothetical protein
MNSLQPDPREIARGLQLLTEEGSVYEVRSPKTQAGTLSGYFDRVDLIVRAVTQLCEPVPGIYFTINPTSKALLARASNRLKARVTTTTSDRDIVKRRWIPIDVDPIRPAGISASNQEHELALDRCRAIRFELSEEGWLQPILADSGNGGYLFYSVELPNDAPSEALVKQVLKGLAARFNDSAVQVDQSLSNAARIVKIFGSIARKGDNVPDRPHRLSRIIDAPSIIQPVPQRLLEEFAATLKDPDPPRPGPSAARGQFDIQDFIARHLKAGTPEPYEGGWRWRIDCPFDELHRSPDAAVFQRANGSLAFKCFHNSCAGKGWRDVRELFEGPRSWTPRESRGVDRNGRMREPPPGSDTGDAESHGQQACAGDDWPQPEPLQEELPPVLAFDAELLPDSFRPLVADVSERMQIPLDLPAAAMVVCLAGVVNRRATIQPKACDAGWIIPLNLWGGIVAPPGFLKSPTLRTITAPLYAIERVWREEYQTELDEYETEKEAAELRLAAWKEQTKATFKKGAAPPLRPDTSLRPPTQKRLIIGDATFEKLHELMAENPAGLFVVRDELSGWMSQQDRPGREGERSFNLECWNGDVGHTIDRISRGSIYVPACSLSMLGGVTPGRLRSYLTDALEDRPGNDGLLQRFQVLVYPDCPSDWHYVDRPPDARSEQQAFRIFQKLAELDADTPVRLRFDCNAQELFIAWLSELEGKIRGSEMHPALIAHLAKYRRLMPAIAAHFELAEAVAANRTPETVCLKQAQRAAAWCEYLESHARRVYACVVSPQLRAARELADKIRQRKIGTSGSFSCREVYWKGWRGLDSPEAVKQAAELLEDANWVRRLATESRPLGGRPADRYTVNPRVFE